MSPARLRSILVLGAAGAALLSFAAVMWFRGHEADASKLLIGAVGVIALCVGSINLYALSVASTGRSWRFLVGGPGASVQCGVAMIAWAAGLQSLAVVAVVVAAISMLVDLALGVRDRVGRR